jgi:putative membrane protein
MPHPRRPLLLLAAALTCVGLLAAPAGAQEPNEQDSDWLVNAHTSNLAEIAAGQAAQQSATSDRVRQLGQMFIEMHTQLDTELTAVAEELGVELPAEPTAEQQAQLAQVAANTGEAFDSAWIAQQIGSHQRSQAAGQEELEEGSDERVLTLARNAAPVIAQHLEELRAAANEFGVPASVPSGTGGQAAGGFPQTAGVALVVTGLAALGASGFALRRSRRAA